MNAPPRPVIVFDPKMHEFRVETASSISKALIDLYEAAFGNGDRNAAMDEAHSAPQILTHAVHELFYHRRELTERTSEAELSDAEDPAAIADSQRPFAAAARKEIAKVAGVRPTTPVELEKDVRLVNDLYNERGERLDRVARLAEAGLQIGADLDRAEALGILSLIAKLTRAPYRKPATTNPEPKSLDDDLLEPRRRRDRILGGQHEPTCARLTADTATEST